MRKNGTMKLFIMGEGGDVFCSLPQEEKDLTTRAPFVSALLGTRDSFLPNGKFTNITVKNTCITIAMDQGFVILMKYPTTLPQSDIKDILNDMLAYVKRVYKSPDELLSKTLTGEFNEYQIARTLLKILLGKQDEKFKPYVKDLRQWLSKQNELKDIRSIIEENTPTNTP